MTRTVHKPMFLLQLIFKCTKPAITHSWKPMDFDHGREKDTRDYNELRYFTSYKGHIGS